MAHSTIKSFESTSYKLGEAAQAKMHFAQKASASSRFSRPQPPQLDPHIQQEEAQPYEQESVSRVVGRRPAAHAARTAVARFDPKTKTIFLPDLSWTHLTIYQNVDQPLSFFLLPPGSFGCGEGATHSHGRLRRAVCGARESVFGYMTLPPHTQGTNPTRLASDGTGNDGSVLDCVQELDDSHSRKAFVQIERASLYFQSFEAFQEELQDALVIVFRAHKPDRQSEAQAFQNQISCRHAIDTRGAILSFGSHPEAFCLFCLPVISKVSDNQWRPLARAQTEAAQWLEPQPR